MVHHLLVLVAELEPVAGGRRRRLRAVDLVLEVRGLRLLGDVPQSLRPVRAAEGGAAMR